MSISSRAFLGQRVPLAVQRINRSRACQTVCAASNRSVFVDYYDILSIRLFPLDEFHPTSAFSILNINGFCVELLNCMGYVVYQLYCVSARDQVGLPKAAKALPS